MKKKKHRILKILCNNFQNEVGGSSIIWVFPLVIADSERDIKGIKPWAARLVHQRSDH